VRKRESLENWLLRKRKLTPQKINVNLTSEKTKIAVKRTSEKAENTTKLTLTKLPSFSRSLFFSPHTLVFSLSRALSVCHTLASFSRSISFFLLPLFSRSRALSLSPAHVRRFLGTHCTEETRCKSEFEET